MLPTYAELDIGVHPIQWRSLDTHHGTGTRSGQRFRRRTIYQAFLSATGYHRWHSPVAGTIMRAFVQDGTYHSEADSEWADAVEPTNSQSCLAHVAARAIIIIEADNPVIGLVAFVPVGMSEVSSCMIDPAVTAGHHVAKGDELGYFQFGGSTHCLVFRPGVIADVTLDAIPQRHNPNARSCTSAQNSPPYGQRVEALSGCDTACAC